MKTIAIIGGGITGLSAAYYLQKLKRSGQLDARIVLIEAQETLGGKIHSVSDNGFIMETGADSIVSRKPNVAPMIEELGLQENVEHNATGRSFLYLDGRLRPIPEDTLFGIPLSLESLARSELISAEGKVEALKDFYTPNERFTKEDSIGDFLTGFLGTELVERQIAPVLSGVYSGSLHDLTIASTLPYLLDYKNEYGSIIQGLSANKDKFRSSGGSKFISFSGGLLNLVDRLEKKLTDVDILKGTQVRTMTRQGDHYEIMAADGVKLRAEYVVLGTLHTAAQKVLNDHPLDELFSRFTTGSLISVYMGFDVPDGLLPQDGTGFIVANGDDLACNACTWTSRKWPHTSARNRLLVRMFYKSSNPKFSELQELTEDQLLQTAMKDLQTSLGIDRAPITHTITKWLDSMPVYHIRHHEIVRELEEKMAVRYPNVILAGCSYYGVGIPDCMANGEQTAARIAEAMKR